jgi:SAM-dependent methyltransferase
MMITDVKSEYKVDEPHDWDKTAIPVDQETLLDLSTFFGIEPSRCQARLDAYTMLEMAEEWRKAHPKTAEEMRRFYQKTELYIWELSKWHASKSYNEYKDKVARAIELFPATTHPRVLDYGAGIATASLEFAKAGYQVTIADVPGRTQAFAKHRFQRRELNCSVIEVTEDLPNLSDRYDVVISFDVLEHVPDAEKVMKRLVRTLRVGGAALIVAAFNDHGEHPQHLASNIDHFSKFAWDWALVGAGLRFDSSGFLIKAPATYAVPRKVRWFLHTNFPNLPWDGFYRPTK